MSKKTEITNAQRAWAAAAGLGPDVKGYLESFEANLFRPMNPTTRVSFDQGSGSELADTARSPAKMRAVHSSSALAVNVFDTWVGIDTSPLLDALGLGATSNATIGFEAKYPTGLPGNPPNIDVVIELPNGSVVGIESKFTEWLTPKTTSKPPFKDKYFPSGQGVWSTVGLPQTQKLAEQIQNRSAVFRYLDAPQLAKHALGLAMQLGDIFRLFYVFFDCSGREAEIHNSEIERFDAAAGSELGFQAVSYQQLFERMRRSDPTGAEYLKYLGSRYFVGAA